jgi:hypothetical protein
VDTCIEDLTSQIENPSGDSAIPDRAIGVLNRSIVNREVVNGSSI